MGVINSDFFLPFENPIGFGLSDFVELAVAVLLICFALARSWVEPAASRFARRTVWSMLVLAIAPVVLRMALLPNHPVPSPRTPVEFNHLLVADTLRHFRLANPPHPMYRFFETEWVSQQPAYNSIFPVGNGVSLAMGRLAFGHPWAGAILCVSAFSALCYWMLRAWTTPGWALLGGVVAVLEFGPLSAWMNSYEGGALTAAAVCLATGSLPRLRTRSGGRLLIGLVAALSAMGGIAIALLHNRQATGDWMTRPAAIYRPVTPEQILASRVRTPQRLAPLASPIIILLSVLALERLSRWGAGTEVARFVVFLSFAQFVLWYSFWALAVRDPPPLRPLPDRNSLVFVRYGPQHRYTNEWVYNDADIDRARMIWARDLGARENAQLRRYYPDRTVWLVDADAAEPVLIPYDPEPPPAPQPRPPEPPAGKTKPTQLRFEEVPDVR
jgi:hypothetical protein